MSKVTVNSFVSPKVSVARHDRTVHERERESESDVCPLQESEHIGTMPTRWRWPEGAHCALEQWAHTRTSACQASSPSPCVSFHLSSFTFNLFIRILSHSLYSAGVHVYPRLVKCPWLILFITLALLQMWHSLSLSSLPPVPRKLERWTGWQQFFTIFLV